MTDTSYYDLNDPQSIRAVEELEDLYPEADVRRATIAAEITETIRNFECGDLDDEELDERLATISSLITSWASCPEDVAKQDDDLRWHHDRRNLTDWEITTRLRALLGLVG